MGWLSLTLAGGSFIWIGSWEALGDRNHHHHQIRSKSPQKNPRFYIAVSLISLSFLVNSLISLSDAAASSDRVGSALQLQLLVVASLFLLFAVLGLLTRIVPFPPSLLDLVCLFAFLEEFILFYSQRKDASGIENRYFDLLLFPIAVCFFFTLIDLLQSSESRRPYPRLARGAGLILKGTWLLQMGISFYTGMMVQGCSLHEKSRGNYTIRCTGHPEYHRGRAVATLQFNCHLAFMVVLATAFFSFLTGRHAADSQNYKPIGAEMLPLEHPAKFTLDSDDEDAYVVPVDKSISVEKSDADADADADAEPKDNASLL